MGHARPLRLTILLTSLLLMVGGCSKEAEKKAQLPLLPPPPPAPTVERVAPSLAHALADRTRQALTVTVDQITETPSYSYLEIHDATAKGWLIAPALTVPTAAEITIEQYVRVRDFEALEIGKRFDSVLVAARVNGAGVVLKETGEEAAVDPVLPASGVTVAEVSIRLVQVVKGDMRLNEVLARRTELDGQRIKVRGQVLRVVPRIRDRNWIWLRDGSGEQRGANLPVVIDRPVDPGQVLWLEGRVAIDRKFKIGGSHPVLLEDAVVLAVESSEALLPEEEALGPPAAPTGLTERGWVDEPLNPTATAP